MSSIRNGPSSEGSGSSHSSSGSGVGAGFTNTNPPHVSTCTGWSAHSDAEFEDRPASEWALQPVHVDTWGGLVFVNPSRRSRAAARVARPAAFAARPVPDRGHALPVAQARRRAGQLEDGRRRVHRGLPHAGDPSPDAAAHRGHRTLGAARAGRRVRARAVRPHVHLPQPRSLEVRRLAPRTTSVGASGSRPWPAPTSTRTSCGTSRRPVGSDADTTRRARGRSSSPRWRSRLGCPRSCRTSSSASGSRSPTASTTPRWTSSSTSPATVTTTYSRRW